MKRAALLFLLLNMVVCHAAIYMQTDKNGNTVYSDTPFGHAQRMELPSGNQVSPSKVILPVAVPVSTKPGPSEGPLLDTTVVPVEQLTHQPYVTFYINSPKDQESIQNQPVIPVEITLEPKLQQGDTVQLVLDEKLAGHPVESTHLELNQIDRGVHQLYAIILDSNQKITNKTKSITIYVHRVNINFRPSASQTPVSPTKSFAERFTHLFS